MRGWDFVFALCGRDIDLFELLWRKGFLRGCTPRKNRLRSVPQSLPLASTAGVACTYLRESVQFGDLFFQLVVDCRTAETVQHQHPRLVRPATHRGSIARGLTFSVFLEGSLAGERRGDDNDLVRLESRRIWVEGEHHVSGHGRGCSGF